MNLYKIWQTVNDSYETFDSAVVAASSEEEAKKMHPGDEDVNTDEAKNWWKFERESHKYPYTTYSSWCDLKDVQVKLIGTAIPGIKAGVIVSSFNAYPTS